MSYDINGISVAGSTGEGALLSDDEIRQIIEVIVKENKKGIPIVGGVIRNSVRDAVKTALVAQRAGADALLVTPTFYHGASPEGNFTYYKKIAAEIALPIIVYNVVATNQLTPEEMLAISKIDQVVGVKQIDAERLAAMANIVGYRIKVFSACDDVLYGTYVSGAIGAIAAIATAAPGLVVQQWKAFINGNQQEAVELHRRLYHVFQGYFDEKPFVGKIKALINLQGRAVGKARKPIQEPSVKHKEFIKSKLKQAGLVGEK